MILRVFTEGQYEVDDEAERSQLRAMDERVEAAIAAGDAEAFKATYSELLDLVRKVGTPLADDDLRSSDLMLPPPDVTFEEVQREFSGHGLIPD